MRHLFSLFALVTLLWDYTPGSDPAVQFDIYRDIGCSGVFTKVATQGVASQAFVDDGLQPGVCYAWYVTAQNSAGQESHPSNITQYTPGGGVLTSPFNLRVQ